METVPLDIPILGDLLILKVRQRLKLQFFSLPLRVNIIIIQNHIHKILSEKNSQKYQKVPSSLNKKKLTV